MKTDAMIAKQFDLLARMGDDLLSTRCEQEQSGLPELVDPKAAYQWATSALALIEREFPQDSPYVRNFTHLAEQLETYGGAVRARAVLEAARQDYASGFLGQIRHLVEADLFDDFLDQAGHLLENGYFAPAAVVAGCVLEDAMRKLCVKHGITLPSEPKLDAMNAELAKNAVYDRLVQKRVTAEADLRNKAAHGKWGDFKSADVAEMIAWVRRFLSDFRGR